MVEQRASAPVRIARLAAAVLLVALAAVIAVRLAGRRGGGAPAAAPEPPPEGRVVDLKERIRHQEFKDGRPVVDIRGASFSLGPDGRNHLAGPVEIVNLGQRGQTLSRLAADEVVYDPGSLRFTMTGHVRVESGDLVLEGGSFDYDREAGLFGTTRGGLFASKGFSGRAPEISYREGADEIRLDGGFRVELAAAEPAGRSLIVSGRSFSYARGDRRGRIEGRAAIQGPDFQGLSESAVFVAMADESGLASADLQGGARVVLSGREPSGEGSGEIRADRIAVTFSREPSALAIRTSSPTSLTLRSSPDRTETVLAPAILLDVFRDDGRCLWAASGGVRAEIAEASAVRETLEGEEAAFDAAKILRLAGVTGRPAVADSVEARIEAPEILLDSASGEVMASGGTACVLKKAEGRRAMGFLISPEDISVSCERLELRPEGSKSVFTGRVLVRQGPNAIRAEALETAGDKGGMSGAGSVSITLAEAADAPAEVRTIELEGEEMAYSPDRRVLTLSTKARVRLPGAVLEAGTVSAVVGRDGRTVESLSADGGVTVSRGRYTGRSEAASYDAATGRLVLTGRPVLSDEKGGSARGATLTFDLPDDKIFIENEGPGRSTTVIRS